MTGADLLRALEAASSRLEGRDVGPHTLALTLIGPRSPGPIMGIPCERLGPAPRGGTAWGVRARDLPRAIVNVRRAMAEHPPP